MSRPHESYGIDLDGIFSGLVDSFEFLNVIFYAGNKFLRNIRADKVDSLVKIRVKELELREHGGI